MASLRHGHREEMNTGLISEPEAEGRPLTRPEYESSLPIINRCISLVLLVP